MTDDELKALVVLLSDAAELIEESARESERKSGNADVLRLGTVAGLRRAVVHFKTVTPDVESE